MKQFILLLIIMVCMGAVAIAEVVPDTRANDEIVIEYANEEVPEVIPEVVEEVTFESDFEYYTWLIGYAAELNGIDPELAIAISRLETGNFTSKAFLNGHNFGGLTIGGKVQEYTRETEGLEAYMKCLKWYQGKGMDTAEKMASVYCPVNSDWANKVNQLIKEGY